MKPTIKIDFLNDLIHTLYEAVRIDKGDPTETEQNPGDWNIIIYPDGRAYVRSNTLGILDGESLLTNIDGISQSINFDDTNEYTVGEVEAARDFALELIDTFNQQHDDKDVPNLELI